MLIHEPKPIYNAQKTEIQKEKQKEKAKERKKATAEDASDSDIQIVGTSKDAATDKKGKRKAASIEVDDGPPAKKKRGKKKVTSDEEDEEPTGESYIATNKEMPSSPAIKQDRDMQYSHILDQLLTTLWFY